MTATLDREECTLYSGAAQGAEAAFGAAAERHGIDEVNFTFEGHSDARTRGIRVLTHGELKRGDVSLGYVSRLMNRQYHDTQLFKKVLQTLDQVYWYKSPEDYAKWAADDFVAERALIERLGLMAK